MEPASRADRVAASYGFDAPGVMRNLLLGGGFVTLCGLVPFGLGLSMVAYGVRGKLRMRELMLDAVTWRGDERVLDVGTGAGLLAIGAAKRAPTGHAIGIDTWSTADLSNNSPVRTMENAEAEGVADRLEVRAGDARSLEFADAGFDVVFSLLCLHNIDDEDERRGACAEIARVLKPGGRVLIGDYIPTAGYASALREAGLVVESSKPCFATALTSMWMVVATKP